MIALLSLRENVLELPSVDEPKRRLYNYETSDDQEIAYCSKYWTVRIYLSSHPLALAGKSNSALIAKEVFG